jgi:ubiquitin-like protein Pup
MPEQIKKSSSSRKSSTPAADTQVSPGKEAKNLTADLDSLLDEIDEVLESNTEEFVKSYVQKGGQ